jgi:hypothetical protein
VVGVAYATGCARFQELIGLGSLAAVALSVAALFRPAERAPGAALLVWVVLAAVTEQFAWAATDGGVLVAAAWLVPPVAGGAVLPARGRWLSGVGCWAASFAGVAATTYSVHSVYSGAGLIMVWRS